MEFRANDPGAVQYGNFINYYQFNSAEERIRLLPDNVWLPTTDTKLNDDRPYYVLDVGCNAGNITQLLLGYLSKRAARTVHLLGVDIDPKLIERATASNENTRQIEFRCVDVMNDFEAIQRYMEQRGIQRFNAVCCFSITMWIHLNNHDSGLREFLQKCSAIAELLVIEPQPWKCYRTAVRRMKRSAQECFPNFSELQWRTDVEDKIEEYLQSELKRVKVYETKQTKWMRKICFYR